PRPWQGPVEWTVLNDSHGYRGSEVGPRTPGVYRILAIGDSITYGFNVDQGDPWPRQPQHLLPPTYPERRFEATEAAVPGWSWLQGVRFLELEGSALAPDVVVIGHGTNDRFFPARITDRERLPRSTDVLQRTVRRIVARFVQSSTYAVFTWLWPRDEAGMTPSPTCQAELAHSQTCRRATLKDIEDAVVRAHDLTAAAGGDLVAINVGFLETDAVVGARNGAERSGAVLLDFVARFHELQETRERERAAQLGLAPTRSDASPATPDAQRRVTFRVWHPGARGPMSVRGGDWPDANFRFDERLFDDATHGDEVAGDGVWTTT